MKSSDKYKSRPNDPIGFGSTNGNSMIHASSMSGKKSPTLKKNIPGTDLKQQRKSFDNPIDLNQQKKFFTPELNLDATSPSKQKSKSSREPSSTQGIEMDNVELLDLYHYPQGADPDTMGKAISTEMRSERSTAVERAAQHDSVKELIIKQLEDLEREKFAKRTPTFLSQFASSIPESEKKRRSPFVNSDNVPAQTVVQGLNVNGMGTSGSSGSQICLPNPSSSSPILLGQNITGTGVGSSIVGQSMELSSVAVKGASSVDETNELDNSIDDSSDGTATAVYMSGQVQYSKSNTMSTQGQAGKMGSLNSGASGPGYFSESTSIPQFALQLSSLSDRELQRSFWEVQEQFKMELERRNQMSGGSGGLTGSQSLQSSCADYSTSAKKVVRRGSKSGDPMSAIAANSGAGYTSPIGAKKSTMGSQQEQRANSRPSSRAGGAFLGASYSSKNQGLSSSRDFQMNSSVSPQLGEEPEDREVESAFASVTLESYHARVSTPNNHLRVVSRGSGAVPPNEKMFLNYEKDPPSRPLSTSHSRPSSSRPHSSKSNNPPYSRPPSTMSGSSLSPIPPGRIHSESPLVGKDTSGPSISHARRYSRGNMEAARNITDGKSVSTGAATNRDKVKKKIRDQRSSANSGTNSSTPPDSYLLDRIGSADSADPDISYHYMHSLEPSPYHTGGSDWSSICHAPGHKTVAVKVINPIISRRNRDTSSKQASNNSHKDCSTHYASSNSSTTTRNGLSNLSSEQGARNTIIVKSSSSVTGSTAGSEDLEVVAGTGGLDVMTKGLNERGELVLSPFSAFDDVSVGSNKSFNSSRSGFSTLSSNRKKNGKQSTGGASPHRRSARSQSSTVSVSQSAISSRGSSHM